jgi:hypothetical protein
LPSGEKELGRGVSGAAAAYLRQKRRISARKKNVEKLYVDKYLNPRQGAYGRVLIGKDKTLLVL